MKKAWIIAVMAGLLGCSTPETESGGAGGPGGTRSLPSSPDRPDIILIVIDTLRKDRLGAYGYTRPTSPHIDRLAAGSTRFTRCISQAPWTTPSIASMMTSRYPSRLQITDIPDALADDLELLPEILQRHGYATAAVVSHDFLGSRWNFDQGFERFHEKMATGHRVISSPGVTDAALSVLDEIDERPLFLFVHYFDPHAHYIRHEEFAFDDGISYQGPLARRASPLKLKNIPADRLRQEDIDHAGALYDSEVAFTDHHIGRLLDDLRRRGRYDSALILLTADHGEEFHDHGDFGHTNTLYDELINVPLLLKLPGQTEGGVVNRTVALLDLLPTILDTVGLPVPAEIDGRSLVAPPPAARPVFSETSRGRDLRAVVDGPHKLIRDLRGGIELYDLEADPNETANLAGGGAAAIEAALRAELESWRLAHRAGSGPSPSRVELTEEERARLRSLGYLE